MKARKKTVKNTIIIIVIVTMIVNLFFGISFDSREVMAAYSFETSIKGFPDSYKPYLRNLHKKYPKWKFVPYNTGINFNTAVENELKDDRSLIEKSYSKYLKSTEPGDYNASTGAYIAKDGSSWVTASKVAVQYFMDPRNFLNDTHIYQFEKLAYDSTQTASGVEAVLEGSFMYKTNIGYLTTAGKYKSTNVKYSSKIIEAAKESKVSAYYIASKILQEVGSKKNSKYAGMGASGSVNGEYSSKYKGIYNFYNIGAYTSSNPIANGLAWASSGNTYNRKWNAPGKSMIGGAEYIGEKYINAGQYTTYFQRFNVNKNSTYGLYQHQYMTNIYGAASEAAIGSDAYNEMGVTKLALTFVIPVYKNMPSTSAKVTIGSSSKQGTVISTVNLRQGAGTNTNTLTTLSKNTNVTILEGVRTSNLFGSSWLSNPYWYKVKCVKNNKTYKGYIAASYLNVHSEKSISKGAKYKLPVSVTKGQSVYYMSDNPAVVKVDQSGYATALKKGTTTVRAYTAAGNMSAMTITVGQSYKPSKPVVSGSSKNYNSVTVKWNAQNNINGYYLYRKNAAGKYVIIAKPKGNVNSYVDTNLVSGTVYSYKVKAYRTVSGKKHKSAKSKAVTIKPIPSKVKKPTVTKQGKTLKVTWKKVAGASGYVIYRSTAAKGPFTRIAVTSANNVNCVDKNVQGKKAYFYKVAAYRTVGNKNIYGKKSTKRKIINYK